MLSAVEEAGINPRGMTNKEKADIKRKMNKEKKSQFGQFIPYIREAQHIFRMIDNILEV